MEMRRRFSYRAVLSKETAHEMMRQKYGVNDRAAIRTISNDLMDSLEKRGFVTRKQSDQLSQDVTIREVQRIMRKRRIS